jgi:poly-beta-hydroxyalkanoate depolymerase
MYCYQRDKIRTYWRLSHLISDKAKDMLLTPHSPLAEFKTLRALGAIHEIIYRWTRSNKRPEFNIPSIKIDEQIYRFVD